MKWNTGWDSCWNVCFVRNKQCNNCMVIMVIQMVHDQDLYRMKAGTIARKAMNKEKQKDQRFRNITAPHAQIQESIEKSKHSNDVFVELCRKMVHGNHGDRVVSQDSVNVDIY